MTAAELALWRQIIGRARNNQADLAAAVLKAFQLIRDAFTDAELAGIIESGNVDRLFAEALDQAMMDRAFLPLRSRLRRTVERGFTYAVPSLPGAGKVGGVLAVAFDHLSPNVVTAIRTLETRVIDSLQSDVRETVRAFVENGLRDGVNPRQIARNLRGVIGLGPTQLQEVQNYRDALNGVNGRTVSSYTLRDKRLKPTTPEQIDKAVEAYQKRRIAQNAETVSRTAALDAMKQGQRLSWQDAIEKGAVDPRRLMKKRIGVDDSRERPEHRAINNQIRAFDERYSNGELVSGDNSWNCRCIDQYFVAKS